MIFIVRGRLLFIYLSAYSKKNPRFFFRQGIWQKLSLIIIVSTFVWWSENKQKTQPH